MATALVTDLDVQHPEFRDMSGAWQVYELLYKGNKAMQDHATQFLMKRPKEVNEVYLQRLQRFTYDNIVGTGIGYYQSELFRKDPDIDFHVKGKDSAAKVPDGKMAFYRDQFFPNADRSGTTFIDLWRQIYLSMMLFKHAYVCIDLPARGDNVRSLMDAKASGSMNPYMMVYDPRHVINWEVDQFGNLEWIVIKVLSTRQEFLGKAETVVRWYYYDRQEYRVYEQTKRRQSGDSSTVQLVASDGISLLTDASPTANLIDQGQHSLAKYGRVPVRKYTIPDGLWLMGRVFLPTLRAINQYNAYYWALEMANLAVPVVSGDSEFTQTVSETSVIVLPENGKFEWTEPKGTSFQHAANVIVSQREEIHRQMYLMAQGRSSSASASASSGYSKEMDMMPSKTVLSQYGDIVRAGMQLSLSDVALAHGDEDIDFDVHGMTFNEGDAVQQIEEMEFLEDSEIQSDTLYMEKEKRVALALLPDANRAVVDTVINEIETGPKKSERIAQQQAQQKIAFTNQLQRATEGVAKRVQQAA